MLAELSAISSIPARAVGAAVFVTLGSRLRLLPHDVDSESTTCYVRVAGKSAEVTAWTQSFITRSNSPVVCSTNEACEPLMRTISCFCSVCIRIAMRRLQPWDFVGSPSRADSSWKKPPESRRATTNIWVRLSTCPQVCAELTGLDTLTMMVMFAFRSFVAGRTKSMQSPTHLLKCESGCEA